MGRNVCFVLAYKDHQGDYIPHDYVLEDIEEAIGEAAALVEEDPACDPRVIQVVLDPVSPVLTEQAIVALLEAKQAEMGGDHAKGLAAAITLLKDRQPLVVGDLDQSETAVDLVDLIASTFGDRLADVDPDE